MSIRIDPKRGKMIAGAMISLWCLLLGGVGDRTACPAATPDKSGVNWVRHYEDACQDLVAAADACVLCHATLEELNPYGLDLATVDNLPWLIEDLDSDHDGRTNGQEIADCTLPGDRASVPDASTSWSSLKADWR